MDGNWSHENGLKDSGSRIHLGVGVGAMKGIQGWIIQDNQEGLARYVGEETA